MVHKTVLAMKYQSRAEALFIIKLTLGIYDGIQSVIQIMLCGEYSDI